MPILREKIIQEPLQNLAALKAIDDTVASNGVLVNIVQLGEFKLDKTSTLTADDNLVVQTNSGTGRWINISNWSGTPTATLGGFTSGVAVPNTETPLMFEKLLRPYQTPSFSSFYIQNQTVREVGNALTTTENFVWTLVNAANVVDNTIVIEDLEIPQTLFNNISKVGPAAFDFSTLNSGAGIVRNTIGDYNFRISAQNTVGGTLTRPFAQHYYARQYSGSSVNVTLSNTQILALENKYLVNSPPSSFPFAGGNTYIWYWILSSMTQPVRFRDLGTGFEIGFQSAVTQNVTNPFGIVYEYKGYKSNQILTNALNVGVEFV